MIELNRRHYMDEATGEKMATFAETTALVESVLTGLIDAHETSEHRVER
jgi:N-formylglutamate amidohydrolase